MGKYRKKPVVIDAFQWTGNRDQKEDPSWITDAIKLGMNEVGSVWFENDKAGKLQMRIMTLEGNMIASPGDYIVKGIHGELYPVKPDIFNASYERVEE